MGNDAVNEKIYEVFSELASESERGGHSGPHNNNPRSSFNNQN